MWLCNLCLLLLYLISFSDGYNITNNFDKVSFPDLFIGSVRNCLKEIEISQQCASDLTVYTQSPLKPWAWLMFDSGSKIPSGILSGNWIDLGQFDQCLNIEKKIGENTISGKYCLGTIPVSSGLKPTKSEMPEIPETRTITSSGVVSAQFATCLPDSCSTSDINKLYSCFGIKVDFSDYLCQSKSTQPKLTGGDIATIAFLSVIFGIMLLSTAYDVLLFYSNKKPSHYLLVAFSVFSNGKKLIATSSSASQISCLHGLRVISMMWVIVSHRYMMEKSLPKQNFIDTIRWQFDEENMFVLGATVSVDTFLLLGGFLVSYSFMTAMAKGLKFNIIMFYVHRYLRLTPILAVFILIYATILKHLGSGPLWNVLAGPPSAGCEEYWWSALLYVQNFVNPQNSCISQTWYLSVDTQLFLLSPIILIPLKKWPVVGLLTTTVFLFGSTLASFLVAWFYELRGFYIANGFNLNDYQVQYYFPTYTRAGPWLMGIILGYYIYDMKQNRKKMPMNKITALLLWAVSLTILCACVYTGNHTQKLNYEYDRVANSFYVALLRPGWALGVGWVILACAMGYGGPVNWLLSLPMFQVASKLTYSMYLIHVAMQIIVSGQIRSSTVFSNLDTLFKFWGDFAFTFATAVIFTLAFESPIIIIEKVIFGAKQEKPERAIPPPENGKMAEIP